MQAAPNPPKPPIGPDPLAMMFRSRGYQKQQEQKKKRILILLVFLILAIGFGYGVYAYVNDKWPFEASAHGSPTQPGPSRPSGPSGPPGPSDPTYEWVRGPWGPCSKQCDGGTQTRDVTCQDTLTSATANDSECPSNKPVTSQECNTFACADPPQDCQYGPWGPWDNQSCASAHPCNTTVSLQKRTRQVVQPAVNGTPCDIRDCNLTDYRTCTVGRDTDSVFGDTGKCMALRDACYTENVCGVNIMPPCPPGVCDGPEYSFDHTRYERGADNVPPTCHA